MSKKLVSMGDLRKEGDKPEDKKRNTLYTGGANSGSGQNVIGPRTLSHDDDEDDDEGEGGGDGRAAVDRVFRQQGVGGSGEGAAVRIVFYRNGFVVDDGELRGLDDPANRAFVNDINRGEVPQEIQNSLRARGVQGGEVDVKVEDKRGEDYVPPPYRAFSGAGNALGAGAPPPPTAAVYGAGAGGRDVVLNPALPTTTVMVKLADGRREKVVLNLTHTVGDLQARVAALGGVARGAPFVLLGGFPPKPLAVATATIEAAGLKGAAVTQQPA